MQWWIFPYRESFLSGGTTHMSLCRSRTWARTAGKPGKGYCSCSIQAIRGDPWWSVVICGDLDMSFTMLSPLGFCCVVLFHLFLTRIDNISRALQKVRMVNGLTLWRHSWRSLRWGFEKFEAKGQRAKEPSWNHDTSWFIMTEFESSFPNSVSKVSEHFSGEAPSWGNGCGPAETVSRQHFRL